MDWITNETIALVQSERRINGKVSIENRYYISSLTSNASVMNNTVRTHWSIENSLHWVLDVSFHEDASRIRKDNSPENMAMLRHFAINLLSLDKSSKSSLRAKRHKAAWDLAYFHRHTSKVATIFEQSIRRIPLTSRRSARSPFRSQSVSG